jgi:hypothetical protein
MEVKGRQRRSDVRPERENENTSSEHRRGKSKTRKREKQIARSKPSKRIYVLLFETDCTDWCDEMRFPAGKNSERNTECFG